MSQTVITAAFEEWKAQEAAGGNRVVLDGFVLANVPGLDPDTPISNTETLPPDSQIVYRQDVDKTGVVNNNAVVYSITMGSNIGTFDFNWIGLVNKASGVLAMIVHTPVQRKLKTEDGQQGNAINRSFLMEYDGAATETEINTPAQTWQIDFTARLSGMDEEWRMANFDIYGPGAFFGDGFLVKKDGSKYQVLAGSGYIGGVRATLRANEEITAATLPAKVFADVSWQGALTGRWQAVTTVQASTAEITDYIDGDGFAHYVFAVASIDAGGAVTDLRPIGSIPAQVADGAIKTITAGNNTHKPGATGDVKLGSAADADIQTSRDDITAGRVLVNGSALALRTMLVKAGTALSDFNDLPENSVGFGYSDATSSPGFTGSVLDYSGSRGGYRVQLAAQYNGDGNRIAFRTRNGDAAGAWNSWGEIFHTRNPPTAAQSGALPNPGTLLTSIYGITESGIYAALGKGNEKPTEGMPDDSGNTRYTVLATEVYAGQYWVTLISKNEFYVGQVVISGKTASWCRYYNTGFKQTAADTGALPITGGTMAVNGAITGSLSGSGSYASQNDSGSLAPFFQLVNDASASKFFPILKQRYNQGKETWSLGTIIAAGNFQVFYLSDSDQAGKSFTFDKSGQFIPSNYTNFDNRYLGKSSTLTRLGAQVAINVPNNATVSAPAGCVQSGVRCGSSGALAGMEYRPLQILVNGTWVNVQSL